MHLEDIYYITSYHIILHLCIEYMCLYTLVNIWSGSKRLIKVVLKPKTKMCPF